jgi:acetate kinase
LTTEQRFKIERELREKDQSTLPFKSMANILVLNAGSGSQKVALYEISSDFTAPSAPVWQAGINSTTPGQPEDYFIAQISSVRGKEEILVRRDSPLQERVETLIRASWSGEAAAVEAADQIDLVGHRVVHGGLEFSRATLVDPQVESTIERLGELAPLHNPHSLVGISACRAILGSKTPQFAVFDTGFHRTLPEAAATYAGPFEWIEKGLVRFGFHGISFRYASRRAAEIIGRKDDEHFCQILCHLGGGCSLAAVRGTRSVDTTMGFTPMDGIAMCTRSGAVDPGLILHLLRHGTDLDSLEQILNKQSGLAGLSGMPGDTRIIFPKAREHNRRAELALDVFVHRLRAGIGSMLASLGHLDALIFTDVIGETEPVIRERVCDAFGFLNLRLNPDLNASSPADTDIAATDSSVRVMIIQGQENWQIAVESFEAWRDATSG